MKVLLKKDFTHEGDDGDEVIGSGTVVTGARAEAALADGAGVQIEDNAPNFNPLPGQGVAAAPFNVNGVPTDPVADQYVGQGTAEQTTGTNPTGTAVTLSQEDLDKKAQLERDLANATTDEERDKASKALEKFSPKGGEGDDAGLITTAGGVETATGAKAKGLPLNKAKSPSKNK